MQPSNVLSSCLTLCFAIGLSVCHLPSSFASEEKSPEVDENAIAAELSVAPSDHREYPKDRPAWVDSAPNLTGMPHRWPVASAPCRSDAMAEESLLVNMRAAVETYVETITGASESGSIVKLDDEWLRQHRDKTKDYRGTIQEGDETLYEAATVLVITPEDQTMIKHLWQQHLVSQRLAGLGVIATGVVAIFVSSAAGLSIVTRRAEKRVTG